MIYMMKKVKKAKVRNDQSTDALQKYRKIDMIAIFYNVS